VQVSASKTKIYMVLEYVNGGELFDKIVTTLPLLNCGPPVIRPHACFLTPVLEPHTSTGGSRTHTELSPHRSIHALQALKGKLTEKEGRKLFQQLIDAVGYCHEKGVCHRDLKVI
jgi:5'-AMP-activated protein kinase, catalytic alpha subunit